MLFIYYYGIDVSFAGSNAIELWTELRKKSKKGKVNVNYFIKLNY